MMNHISLSDFVLNRVRCLVSFRILLRELNSDLWLCVSWVSTRGAAQPSPTQPGPVSARAPLAPVPSPCAPPPLVSFPSFNSPAQQPPSLSHLPLSPRGALGFGVGPRGEFPSPLPLSLFPSPSPSSSLVWPLCARPWRPRAALAPPRRLPPTVPLRRGPLRAPGGYRAAPLHAPPHGPLRAPLRPPAPPPPRGPAARPARPCPVATRPGSPCAFPCAQPQRARRSNLSLISF
jgi:hypothetical protein